jgi:hypothetical protein
MLLGLIILFSGHTIAGYFTSVLSKETPVEKVESIEAAPADSETLSVTDTAYKWVIYLRGVILPTLAIAWLLRLISRQYITQMALQEDARLRRVLIHTFLSLQRNPDAEMNEKERAHMLEAIFRPLPTTPNGDVNQPSFADIAKLPK